MRIFDGKMIVVGDDINKEPTKSRTQAILALFEAYRCAVRCGDTQLEEDFGRVILNLKRMQNQTVKK